MGAMIVALVHIGIGTTLAFSGVILPQLTDENTEDLYFEQSEAALFSKLFNSLPTTQQNHVTKTYLMNQDIFI